MVNCELLGRMKKYQFYHTIRLTDDLQTEGWPVVRTLTDMTLRHLRTLDLRGKRVLDIGCRDGLFSFEAEKLGAAEVIGIDNDPSVAAREFLIPYLRSRVRMEELNVYDLRPETFGRFDVVIFPGVLYHLRYPIWALKLVRDVVADDGVLVLETAVLEDDNRLPLLYCPVGAESPYEPTSCTFFNLKALKDTLASLGLTARRVECLNPTSSSPPPLKGVKAWVKAALGRTPPPEPPKGPVINRATLVCARTPESADPQVTAYWDGAHRIHSQSISPTVFRDYQPR
jgi:SAM-dependent methyltransferase